VDSLAQYEKSKKVSVVLIHCRNGLWYSATKQELDALFDEALMDQGVSGPTQLEEKLGVDRTPILFPDLPLSSALPHFRRWPLLPISNRALRGSLEGCLSLEDVLKRYQKKG
jgi:CIC family chloride channel protein